jgi:hypothetical protein
MRALVLMASLYGLDVSPALAYCSEPSAPYCATRYGTFDGEDEFRRCKREMESYQSEAQDFLSCQKREVDDLLSVMKRKSDGVIEEYNSAVESFNRRARG